MDNININIPNWIIAFIKVYYGYIIWAISIMDVLISEYIGKNFIYVIYKRTMFFEGVITMVTILILVGICSYSGYVLYKKYKDIKKGKFCSCGCDSCPSKSNCHK